MEDLYDAIHQIYMIETNRIPIQQQQDIHFFQVPVVYSPI
jgi:hypothetical protein